MLCFYKIVSTSFLWKNMATCWYEKLYQDVRIRDISLSNSENKNEYLELLMQKNWIEQVTIMYKNIHTTQNYCN